MKKIIEEHIVKEKTFFSGTIYTKRIVYEKDNGELDFIRFRVDESEYNKER